MKILIADDSRVMRQIVIRTLRQAGHGGHEIVEAENGAQALEMVRSEAPDLVLSDWNMPEMNGLEFIRAVRQDARFTGLVILMVTTETETDQMLRALSAGADEYLMKPFQKDALIDKLRMVGVVN